MILRFDKATHKLAAREFWSWPVHYQNSVHIYFRTAEKELIEAIETRLHGDTALFRDRAYTVVPCRVHGKAITVRCVTLIPDRPE